MKSLACFFYKFIARIGSMNDENNNSSEANDGAGSPPPPPPADDQGATDNDSSGTSDPKSAKPQSGDGTLPSPPTDNKGKLVSPLQKDDEISEDQFVTGGDDHSFITNVPIPAHPNTQFDEKKFLELLAKSISLTKLEKQRIIASIPKLSQYQIDELMRIFTEEQKKFSELNKKHSDQLKELEAKHKEDWNDVEMQAKQKTKSKEDEDEAAKLRKKLGL